MIRSLRFAREILSKVFGLTFFYGIISAFLAFLMTRADNLSKLQDNTIWFCAYLLGAGIGRIIEKLNQFEEIFRSVAKGLEKKR